MSRSREQITALEKEIEVLRTQSVEQEASSAQAAAVATASATAAAAQKERDDASRTLAEVQLKLEVSDVTSLHHLLPNDSNLNVSHMTLLIIALDRMLKRISKRKFWIERLISSALRMNTLRPCKLPSKRRRDWNQSSDSLVLGNFWKNKRTKNSSRSYFYF